MLWIIKYCSNSDEDINCKEGEVNPKQSCTTIPIQSEQGTSKYFSQEDWKMRQVWSLQKLHDTKASFFKKYLWNDFSVLSRNVKSKFFSLCFKYSILKHYPLKWSFISIITIYSFHSWFIIMHHIYFICHHLFHSLSIILFIIIYFIHHLSFYSS